MSRDIKHDSVEKRFEWTEEGLLSFQTYDYQDGVMTILHTEVPEAAGGRGIAGDLTRTALDTARANGWKVKAQCAYADAFIRRHPEYLDLTV